MYLTPGNSTAKDEILARNLLGLNQSQLARKVKRGRSAISMLEKNEGNRVSNTLCDAINELLEEYYQKREMNPKF